MSSPAPSAPTAFVSESAIPILLVGAFDSRLHALRAILALAPCEIQEAATYAEALGILDRRHIGVAICDTEIADGNWRLLLGNLQNRANPPNLIVSSRLADERLWAEVLNLGGYDVLMQPFERSEVLRVARMAWMHWRRQFHIRAAAAGEGSES
jgi:DNA-binding NtrC family response regulator